MGKSTALMVAALLFGTGCGSVHYAVNATTAAGKLAEAREVGAETYAPYEYYYARAHLEQAQVEAAAASYGDAAHYAETAEEFAVKAIEATKEKRREASSK